MYPQEPQRVRYEYATSTEDAYFQRDRYNLAHDALQRLVLLAGSTLTALLAVRFVLALLAANTTNGIVLFVNNITAPFVAPFVGLLHYDHASLGAVSFQGYTLVAILAYSLLAAGLARLVSITRY